MVKQTFGKSTLIFAAVICGVCSMMQETVRDRNIDVFKYFSDLKYEYEKISKTIQAKLEPISKLIDTVDQLRVQQKKVEEDLQFLVNISKINFGEMLSTVIRQGNSIQRIQLLVEAGVYEYEDNKKGRLILSATENSQDRIIEMLIENFADVDVHGRYGYSPLHWTAYNGCLKCAKLLLEGGAEINTRDNWMDTPLIKSSKYGYTELVKLFLSKGASVVAWQEEGYNALHMAAREGRVDVVKLLLAHGANPTSETKKGDTPLDFAMKNNHKEVIALLEKRLSRKPGEQKEGNKS